MIHISSFTSYLGKIKNLVIPKNTKSQVTEEIKVQISDNVPNENIDVLDSLPPSDNIDTINNLESLDEKSLDNAELEIKSAPEIKSPTVYRKILFKVPKDVFTYPILKSNLLTSRISSQIVKDLQTEDSQEQGILEVENPCDKTLPHVFGEYFIDNKYVSSTVSYVASVIDNIETYAMEKDWFTVEPFLYCGSKEVPNPTTYDFLANITTNDTTVLPIDSTSEYYLYQIDVEGYIYLAPLVVIDPLDTRTLEQLNFSLGKDPSNNEFTRGELASILYLGYDHYNPRNNFHEDILKYFSNLEFIDFSYCNYDHIPTEVASLYNLKTLIYFSNNISIIPPEIGSLTNLEYLDLESNQITSLSAEFGNLNNLRTLYCAFNNLTTLPQEFANLNKLEYASFRSNNFSSIPSQIGNLANLVGLNFAFNNISVIPSEMSNLTNLTFLVLNFNNISVIPPEMGDLTNLAYFGIDNNKVFDLSMFTGYEVFISANNEMIDRGNLSQIGGQYRISTSFLIDTFNNAPEVKTISDGGVTEVVGSETFVVWDSGQLGKTVNFTFNNDFYFSGTVTVTLV